MSVKGNWAIAVHGGAGAISRETILLPYEQALESSVNAAYEALANGISSAAATPWQQSNIPFPSMAVAAALAAVETLEDSPLFNAGT